jgi:hypothetical protein
MSADISMEPVTKHDEIELVHGRPIERHAEQLTEEIGESLSFYPRFDGICR